jgi:hypothetical protein
MSVKKNNTVKKTIMKDIHLVFFKKFNLFLISRIDINPPANKK